MAAQLKLDLNLMAKELCEYHIRLIGYSKQAHKELKHNIARIFEALSFSKQIQALYILNCMGCFRNTKENLFGLMKEIGTCSIDKPVEYSDISGIKEVIARFNEIEEKNKHIYACAKDSSDVGKDLNIGTISVCSKCGYLLLGDTPNECIMCHAPSGVFRLF